MFGGSDLFGASQGFGATQATQDGGGGRKPRTEEKQTSLPVTLQTLELAVSRRTEGDEDVKIFGLEPNTLLIVACVEAVVKQSTGLELTLNDSTARMKARYFVTDPEASHLDSIVPGCYISGFGEVRTAPATHMVLNGARVIASADEISYHMIESVHTALRLKQQAKQQAEGGGVFASEKQPAQAAGNENNAANANSLTPQKTGGRGQEFSWASTPAAAATALPMQQDSQGPGNDATPVTNPTQASAPVRMQGAELRAAVLGILRDDSVDAVEGVNIDVLCKRLGNLTKDEVQSALAGLQTDGEVYNSIDENHWTAL